ncbi:hypothetical protein GTQ40_04310 [Flavobacteriaceae bacterium R38]|nr:hypothetical protein [Flavobacteriaceae bacterium R38]
MKVFFKTTIYKFQLGITILLLISSCNTSNNNFKLVNNRNNDLNKVINHRWHETDTSIALYRHENLIWQYNFKTKKGKPYFHPININNITLSELSPKDHPWHLGIWHSWKFINGVNYWEYNQSEGSKPWHYDGQTELRSLKIKKGKNYSCIFELDIAYHKLNNPDVLTEKRTIKVSAPDENSAFTIDYAFNFTAIAETVRLDRTPLPHERNGKDWGGYTGLSVRFNNNLTPSSFIYADGSTTLGHGKSNAWAYYGLKDVNNNTIGTAIFDHPKNYNHPTPWYVTTDRDAPLYYLGPAPIFNDPHLMKANDKLFLKYRLKFYTGKVIYNQLKKDWEDYSLP